MDEPKNKQQQGEEKHSYQCQQNFVLVRSSFEWIQLIATLTVPIAIGVFTILNSFQQIQQSKNQFDVQLKIAAENRQKDLFIASENRRKDLDIAADNRKKDLKVAEVQDTYCEG